MVLPTLERYRLLGALGGPEHGPGNVNVIGDDGRLLPDALSARSVV